MITLAGIIGSGKSSLTERLAKELGTKPFFEPVEDNPVLPLFYKGNKMVAEGEAETNPYAYLLQTFFLNRRFDMIKRAMQDDNNVLDRSIYEDAIFMKMNTELGNATQVEYDIYKSLLDNMLEELPYASHKKSPDLMIMIDVSYDTMIKRIKKRGREFEQIETDPSLVEYYQTLLKYYAEWKTEYNSSPLLVIDGDKYDFVSNEDDYNTVLNMIEEELVKLGNLTQEQYTELRNKRENN